MNEVYAALAKVQAELPGLKRSATNPHFKSKYIPLDAIHEAVDPILAKHGLVWAAFPGYIHTTEVTPSLHYSLTHVESGDTLSADMPLLLDKQNSQGVGSAITYARRYALSAVLGIIADEDDDGNKASAPLKKVEEKPADFAEVMRNTKMKAADIKAWLQTEGGFEGDVAKLTGEGLAKFLNGLDEGKRAKLLKWAS